MLLPIAQLKPEMIAHTRNTRAEVPDNALPDNLVLQNNLMDGEAILNFTGHLLFTRIKLLKLNKIKTKQNKIES